ncbi:MAG: beta-ketoacyl-ACP synthase, partial [Rhizobiales bacterium]|nr:beta-ketoacyl-ACP synthase [Hyphomicrobiales bacterium]
MAKTTDHLGRPIVVVTGIGIITSLGVGRKDNWDALSAGRSGMHEIKRFPTDELKTRICGMVDFLGSSDKGPAALTYEMAETTAIEALSEAGLDGGDFGGPLFLAAPPVELSWRDRFDLYKM